MKLDLNDVNHQLIVAAMTNLVDEGHSPREVFSLLEDIKKNTFSALMQLSSENK